jgi:hypothetical protein
MARTIGEAMIRVRGDTKEFSSSLKGLAGSIVGIFAGLQVASFLKESIDEAREAAKVGRQTEAVLKSTGGAAQITADQVGELATRLSNLSAVDDEVIQSGENVLLTFTAVRNQVGKGNDIFNQATAAALDMSAALGQDMQSSVIQLGKALNDPIKGITALSRVGVSFTTQQKEQIAAMVESGNVMGAQKIILKELSTEFGGAAAAAADPAQKAVIAWGNFKEMIGGFILPIIGKLADFFSNVLLPVIQGKVIPFVQMLGRAFVEAFKGEGITSTGVVGAFERVGVVVRTVFLFVKGQLIPVFLELAAWLRDNILPIVIRLGRAFADDLVPVIITVFTWIKNHVDVVKSLAIAFGIIASAVVAVKVAMAAWAVVMAIINGVLAVTPLGWIVITLGALVVAIVLAWRHSETFRDVVKNTWEVIGNVASWLWNTILQPIFLAWKTYISTVLIPVILWLWENVIRPAFQGIAAAATFMWENVLQPLFKGWWAMMTNVIIPIIMFLWRNAIEPAFKAIAFAVQVAWAVISTIFAAWVNYLKTFVFPVILFLWRVIVEPAMNAIGAIISAVWRVTIKPVFDVFKKAVGEEIPNAFKKAVQLVSGFWEGLKEVVRGPAKWVVDHVLNPLIDAFNAVAKAVGGKTIPRLNFAGAPVGAPLGTFRGLAVGGFFDGRLPGTPSAVDNMLARGPGGGMLALASGEYVVNARSTSKWLPVLEWINGQTARGQKMDGYYQVGGLVGDIINAFTDPAKWVKDRLAGAIGRIPGAGTFRDTLVGMGNKLVGAVVDWVKSHLFGGGGGPGGAGPGFLPWPSSPGAQRGDSGVWHSILNLVRASGIPYTFGNAYRPGDPLWHGSGRAVDFMGYNQDALAQFFMARQSQVLELIHRTNTRDYGITRGRIRAFPTQWPLHRNHLHIAMDQGGYLEPGWNGPLFNGTGRRESITPAVTMDAVVARLDRLIDACERVGPVAFADALRGNARYTLALARGR